MTYLKKKWSAKSKIDIVDNNVDSSIDNNELKVVDEMKKYLLIKFSDDQELFTTVNNYNFVVDLVKTLNATVHVVKTKDPAVVILSLQELAAKIAKNEFADVKCNFEVVEDLKTPEKTFQELLIGDKPPKVVKPIGKRSEILLRAKEIRSYVVEQLKNGNNVTVDELKLKYKDLSKATLYSHIYRAKKQLKEL